MKYALPIVCMALMFVAGWVTRGLYDSGSLLVQPADAIQPAERPAYTSTPAPALPPSQSLLTPKPNPNFRVPPEPPGGYPPLRSGGVNDLR